MRGLSAILLMIGALLSTGVSGAPAEGGAQPASRPANDVPSGALTALGNELIARLPPIAFGTNLETLVEAKQNDKPYATSRSTLVSKGARDEIRYAYTDISTFRSPDGTSIEVKTTGTFDRRFRPEKLEWEIIHQRASGEHTKTVETLEIGDEEMVSIKTDAAGKTIERRMPAPKEDFVYLTGDLLRLLKPEPGQTFILNDLDPDTGRLNRRTYRVTKKDEKHIRIGIRKHPSKVETEYYLIAAPGTIMRHEIYDPGIAFTATTKPRILAIENAVRRLRH